MKFFQFITVSIVAAALFLSPSYIVHSADSSLVFCNQSVDQNGKFVGKECGWPELIQLLSHIINYITLLSIPLAAIAFSIAGFKVMSAGGSMKGRDEAKKIFENVVTGLFFILAAWLIVNTILVALVKTGEGYSILGN